MLDLTNKTVDELNALMQKYSTLLEFVPQRSQPYFVSFLEVAVNHLQPKELNKDLKALAVVAAKKNWEKLNSEDEIITKIDSFIEFYTAEFSNYCQEMVYTDIRDLECSFVHLFSTKNGSI